MSIVQDTFYIEDSIYNKLLTGEYTRIGSVVRNQSGQIVKHLDPIDLPQTPKQAKTLGQKLFQFVSNHKKEILIIGTATVVTVLIAGATYVIKRKREPIELTTFRAKLKVYIDSIRIGKVNFFIIQKLKESIVSLKQHKNSSKFLVELSLDEIGTLIDNIKCYTIKLANDNKYECEIKEDNNTFNSLINLLEIQEEIFLNA